MAIDPVSLSQDLIRRPSVTPVDAGALDVLQRALESLGFTCHRLPFGDGAERTDNLYARLGRQGPNLCYAGHTDVVPPGDDAAWTHPPYAAEIVDGDLYGRGAQDMKAAIACWVAAVSDLLASREDFGGSLSLLITGDEEGAALHGTRKVLDWLKTRGETLDACVVGEPTNPKIMGEMMKIGRRGSVSATITVQGTQGHVAYPHLADNPTRPLIAILHALTTHRLDDGTAFFQPSNLEVVSIDVGNPADNVIPARASALLNIRFNDLHTSDSLKAWILDTCARLGGGRASVTFRVSGESFLTPPGPLSAHMAEAVREVTGRTPDASTTGGTSDARFIKDACPVIEFGITGDRAHKVDERVAVADIHTLTAVYRRFLDRFFGLAA